MSGYMYMYGLLQDNEWIYVYVRSVYRIMSGYMYMYNLLQDNEWIYVYVRSVYRIMSGYICICTVCFQDNEPPADEGVVKAEKRDRSS